MPRLEYFIVSESYAIDQDTNRISAFNIIETIQVKPSAFPTTVSQLCLLSCWLAGPDESDDEFQLAIQVQPPGDVEPKTIRLNFTVEGARIRATLTIRSIPIEHLGEIEIELLLNDEHQARHVITVMAADEESEASADSDAQK